MMHALNYEGRAVCHWLSGAGLHCAVLEYRLVRLHPAPLLDARRAVQLARANSQAWHVDTVRIIVWASVRAATWQATHVALSWDIAAARAIDEGLQALGDRVAAQLSRPDAAVLAYPVVSARNHSVGVLGQPPHTCTSHACVGRARRGEGRPIRHHGSIKVLLGARLGKYGVDEASVSLDELASSTPRRRFRAPAPLFLWHTSADALVPVDNTLRLHAALLARGGSVESHVFQGPLKHGLALAHARLTRGKAIGRWPAMCLAWMARTIGIGVEVESADREHAISNRQMPPEGKRHCDRLAVDLRAALAAQRVFTISLNMHV